MSLDFIARLEDTTTDIALFCTTICLQKWQGTSSTILATVKEI